ARLRDQEQVFAREVPFAGLKYEANARHRAGQSRRRAEDPDEILGPRIGVVALQAQGDSHGKRDHDETKCHDTLSARRRRRHAQMYDHARSTAASAITHASPGSTPCVTPTARSDTPSGNGSG